MRDTTLLSSTTVVVNRYLSSSFCLSGERGLFGKSVKQGVEVVGLCTGKGREDESSAL